MITGCWFNVVNGTGKMLGAFGDCDVHLSHITVMLKSLLFAIKRLEFKKEMFMLKKLSNLLKLLLMVA